MGQPPLVTIYTDGSCRGNPGPGGWAAILTGRAKIKTISAGEPETTNNRMELMGPIEGLRALSRPTKVLIVSDSEYVVKGMTQWLPGWQKRRFKNVKNADLWQALIIEADRHDVEWQWVRGHSGNTYNELADKLANKAAQRQTRLVRCLPSAKVAA